MRMQEQTFTWDNPQEWLAEKIQKTRTKKDLMSICNTLLSLCDADQIQDTFQSEMEDDKYFEPNLVTY